MVARIDTGYYTLQLLVAVTEIVLIPRAEQRIVLLCEVRRISQHGKVLAETIVQLVVSNHFQLCRNNLTLIRLRTQREHIVHEAVDVIFCAHFVKSALDLVVEVQRIARKRSHVERVRANN